MQPRKIRVRPSRWFLVLLRHRPSPKGPCRLQALISSTLQQLFVAFTPAPDGLTLAISTRRSQGGAARSVSFHIYSK
jgi:hypothetical protein